MISAKPWTEAELKILHARAAEFTRRGKRIKWGDFAHETGHPESSCAQKYHGIRKRATGLLTRALIDARLAEGAQR